MSRVLTDWELPATGRGGTQLTGFTVRGSLVLDKLGPPAATHTNISSKLTSVFVTVADNQTKVRNKTKINQEQRNTYDIKLF